MSIAVWSIIWQVVVAGACLAFFGLAACVAGQALRDARDMFRELRRPDSGKTDHDAPG